MKSRLFRPLLQPDRRDCDEVRSLFSDYADEELDPALRQRVEEHASFCPRCRRALTNFRYTLGRLRRLGESSAPSAGDRHEVEERVRRSWRERS